MTIFFLRNRAIFRTFVIQSANLDTLWRKPSLRDLYENNFPWVEFNKI